MLPLRGHEPIEALGRSMHQAMEATFPEVSRFELVHYKVHALESRARIRIVVALRDGQRSWQTIGVSDNMLAAFCAALNDALIYGLDRTRREAGAPDPAGSASRLRNRESMPHTQSADCTLTVALRHSRGALARLAVTLSSMPVSALSYAAPDVKGARRKNGEFRHRLSGVAILPTWNLPK